jgi:hypothetical protein
VGAGALVVGTECCACAGIQQIRIAASTSVSTSNVGRALTEGLVAHRLLKLVRTAPRLAPRRTTMLETIAVILIILWLLGMVSGYTMGNFIYVLLVIAIVLFLVRLISGRRV